MRRAAFVAIVLAACLSDAPPVEEGTTTGGSCPVGSVGCPCTPGGACDEGLQCSPPDGPCFDPQCTKGAENCQCADGACLGGELQCIDGFCSVPPSSTTAGSMDGTNATTASTGTTTATATATSGAESISITGTVESGATTEITGVTTTTGEVTCPQCFDMAAIGCDAASCLSCARRLACFTGGSDHETCCNMAADEMEWDGLAGCIDTACPQCTSIACN